MIWERCHGVQHIQPVQGTLFRLVESQQQVATLGFVDTLEEQVLLEEMLESIKPIYTNTEQSINLHYLLKTPFRYPPLKWGSRFGQTYEPSIFYGAQEVKTTLAESAYYRFVFWYSMEGEPIKHKINSEHTVFSIDYETHRGVQLQNTPFNAYQSELTHPQHYQSSQQVGAKMREADVEVFEYQSARNSEGTCVGLFSPKAFVQKKPTNTNQWLCEVSANMVSFKPLDSKEVTSFSIDLFLIENRFPLPA